MASSRPAVRSAEFASLAERMGYLQALRAALAAVVLASGFLAAGVVGARIDDLMLITAGYLLLSATVEGLRRMNRGRGLTAVGGMLLVDGLYLAWVMYQTGGTQSALRFLVYLHLIAVTLLASYRTGLKVALWHSLLFFCVFYAQASGIIEPLERGSEASSFETPSFFNVVAFWLVALVTTAFSSINERELRRRKADVESLARVAAELEDVQTPDEVGKILLGGVQTAFGFRRGAVVAARGGRAPELLAYEGPDEDPAVGAHLDASVAEAWERRAPVLLKRIDADADPQLATLLPFGKNVVIVPLSAEGTPVGAVALEYESKKAARIERRVVEMVTQFAAHAGLALRNAWLLSEVKRLADTDALTGIANRRVFEASLERELSRAVRNGEQVTLVMLDVDHFKALNDTHGHQTGDEVLKRVAASLAKNCRDFDIPARYGGEEFCVILPSCSAGESLVAAERLRKGISTGGSPVAVTASAGVATFPTHAPDADALIKAADEALYESKRAGRDRVTRSRRAPATAPRKQP